MCRYTTFWIANVLKATIGKKTSITFKKFATGNNVFNYLSYYLQ